MLRALALAAALLGGFFMSACTTPDKPVEAVDSDIQGYAEAMLICRSESAILGIAAGWQESREDAGAALRAALRQRLCVTLPRPRVVGLIRVVYEYVDVDNDRVEVWEIDSRDVPMWTLVMAEDQPEPGVGA